MDKSNHLESGNYFEKLLLDEIISELSNLEIPYKSLSLIEIIKSLEEKEKSLYINLQPTYAQHFKVYTRLKFKDLRKKILSLNKWEFGSGLNVPKVFLLFQIIILSYECYI